MKSGILATTILCLGILSTRVPAGEQPEPDVTPESLLGVGKHAAADKLYDIADQRLALLLTNAAWHASQAVAEEALALLAQTRYEQGKYEEALAILAPGSALAGEVNTRESGSLSFWEAAACYGLRDYSRALTILEQRKPIIDLCPLSGPADRLRAWCHLAVGQTNAALAAFARYDQTHASSRSAAANRLEWAQALAGANMISNALALLTELVKTETDAPAAHDARFWLARLHMRQNMPEQAIAALTPLLTNERASPDLRAEAAYLMANAKELLVDREGATACFRQGISLAKSVQVRQKGAFGLGRFLLDQDRTDEALPVLHSAIAEFPAAPEAETLQLRLASTLLAAGRSADSVIEFQRYLETFTNSAGYAQANYGKGWALLRLDRYAEAAAAFNRAYTLFQDAPTKAQCLFKIGDAYYANDQFKLAADAYRRMVSEFPDSELTSAGLLQFGESLAAAGLLRESIAAFMRVTNSYPRALPAEQAALRIAEIQERMGEHEEALQGYHSAMNSYTTGTFRADALYGRGLVSCSLFRYPDALADFEKVVTEYPVSEPAQRAFYMRAMCHYWMGQDNRAIEICRQFLTNFPTSVYIPDVLYWLGRTEFNLAHYPQAQDTFSRLATNYPSSAIADSALFWSGMAAFNRKEFAQAIETMNRLTRDYPASSKMPEARLIQAESLCEHGKFAEAILVLDEIIHKFPRSEIVARAWGRRGDCQFTLGTDDPSRYEKSIDSYRMAMTAPGASLGLKVQAEYKIGRTLEKMGRVDEAFNQYYINVILKYFDARDSGILHDESAKLWFTKAAFNAADIMEARQDWAKVIGVLDRIVKAGVPGSDEADARIRRIRKEKQLQN